MKLHLNITGKLALILVSFGAALLIGLGSLAYTSGQAGLQQAATSELLTRAFEKQAVLDNWITTARTNIATQAESPVIAEQAAALLSAAPGSPEALAAHDQLVKELQPHIGPETEFTELFFIEAESGQVLAATDLSEEGKFKENLSFFINGRNGPYVSEMYYSVTLNRPAMTAAAPVISEDGRLLGVLAGRLDLGVLNTFINRRTGLRQTDDAYLVNNTGVLATQPRFMPDPAILQKALRTEAVTRCIGGNSGVISAGDYRSVPALISYRWLPERKMCLIVKIDQAEAFAPSLAFGRTIALASGLALVSAIALAIMIASVFTRPILALQTGVKRLGQGDLGYRVAVKSSDEVGLLTAAFNEMAASLEKQVTERKRAEQQIQSLIESMPDGVLAVNAAGNIVVANVQTEAQFGYQREELLGQPIEMLLPERVRTIHHKHRHGYFAAPATRSMGSGMELYARRKDGSEFPVDISLSAVETEHGRTAIAIVRDITERKRAEQALQVYTAKLEQSNRDLQEFAYVASHDLQEPLRKVQAFSDRLATKYTDALDETGHDYLKRMRDASQRMQILINDLLGFSRVSTRAQPFTKVDLNSIAREVLSDLESRIERANARVEIGELPTVKADSTQMHQLLQNLIGNALKFHHKEHPPLIKVSAKIKKDTCVISVEDNGIGFDTQYLDRIFKPFQRLHNREEYEGSGMGLAICRRIVERHGGSITATSTTGKGTTFLVTLPTHQSKGDK